MLLPGRLSASTLGDLLGALHRDGITGLLELSEIRGPRGLSVPGRIHRIHLRGGLVAWVDTTLPVQARGDSHLRDRLDAVFSLEEAAVTFRTARPLSQTSPAAPLQPRDFLHGRPRARDRENPKGPSLKGPSIREEHETPPPRSGVRPIAPEDPKARARRVLGLAEGAGIIDVLRAFRRLAAELHPDRAGLDSTEEKRRRAARFAELSAAYHLLVA